MTNYQANREASFSRQILLPLPISFKICLSGGLRWFLEMDGMRKKGKVLECGLNVLRDEGCRVFVTKEQKERKNRMETTFRGQEQKSCFSLHCFCNDTSTLRARSVKVIRMTALNLLVDCTKPKSCSTKEAPLTMYTMDQDSY